MQKLVFPVGIIFSFFLILYIFARIAGPVPISLNSVVTNKTESFTSTGEGEAVAAPDIARVTIGVSATGADVESTQNEVNTKVKSITDELKKLGVKDEDIKTTSFTINPEYNFENPIRNITGYSVSQNMEITADPINKINPIIDTATSQGANVVGNVSFDFNEETKAKLTSEARKTAIDDAKKNAGELAKLSGIKLGRIINVTESSFAQPPIAFAQEMKAADSVEIAPTNITAGEASVKLNIVLMYQTY